MRSYSRTSLRVESVDGYRREGRSALNLSRGEESEGFLTTDRRGKMEERTVRDGVSVRSGCTERKNERQKRIQNDDVEEGRISRCEKEGESER